MLDFVGKRFYYFGFSAIFIIIGIAALAIPPALQPSIEFTGGSTLDITFSESVRLDDVRAAMSDLGHPDAVIQRSGLSTGGDRVGDSYFIRTKTLESPVVDTDGNVVVPGGKDRVEEGLTERLVPIQSLNFFSVSPIIASETIRNAAIAVVVAILFVLLFITWAFRHIPSSFRYGVSAVLALFHDVFIVVGLYSLLSKFFTLEVNTMFIVGVLTIIGYSVNDTIVVFDRIRENAVKGLGRSFEATVNTSIMETMGRSLNTSITLLVVLGALILFGGDTIRPLVVVLLIGLVAGTYSSIAIASQFLVMWEKGDLGRIFRRLPRPVPMRRAS